MLTTAGRRTPPVRRLFSLFYSYFVSYPEQGLLGMQNEYLLIAVVSSVILTYCIQAVFPLIKDAVRLAMTADERDSE